MFSACRAASIQLAKFSRMKACCRRLPARVGGAMALLSAGTTPVLAVVSPGNWAGSGDLAEALLRSRKVRHVGLNRFCRANQRCRHLRGVAAQNGVGMRTNRRDCAPPGRSTRRRGRLASGVSSFRFGGGPGGTGFARVRAMFCSFSEALAEPVPPQTSAPTKHSRRWWSVRNGRLRSCGG